MDKGENILVNIHNFKTYLSRFYKIEFNKINFVKFNDNHNRNLYDKFNSDLNLMESEHFVGVKINDSKIDFKLFEDFNNSISDDDYISYGQCVGNYIVNKKIKPSDYTLFLIVKECGGKVINIDVLTTKSFYDFLREENTNTQFNLLSLDRDIAYLNQLYFGTMEKCFSLN